MSKSPSLSTSARDAVTLTRIQQAERAAAALLPADHPLDPERRRRVDATLPELSDQPEVVARNLEFSAEVAVTLAADIATWGVAPLLYLLPAQLIGYHLAMAKFTAAENAARTAAETPQACHSTPAGQEGGR